MKKSNLIQIVTILLVSAMVMLFSTTVNAANDNNDVHDLTGTLTKIVHQVTLQVIHQVIHQVTLQVIHLTIPQIMQRRIQVFIIIQTIIYQKQVLKIQFQ